MKLKIRKLSMVMAFVVLFLTIPFYAIEAELNNEELTVEMLEENQQIKEEIDLYLSSKLSAQVMPLIIETTELSTLDQNTITRAEAFQNFEENLAVEFINVEVDSKIEEILEQSDEELKLKVYEWTEIEYYTSPDAEIVDVMGYGTHHEMTFEVENDTYTLLEDSYDERVVTGACSADVLESEEFSVNWEEFINVSSGTENVYSAKSNYNVNSVINYAHTYCGIAAASQD